MQLSSRWKFGWKKSCAIMSIRKWRVLTKVTFSKFCHFILWSVGNMMFMSTLLIIFYLASIYGVELPNPKFVTDVVTKFNRFGIIYHLPSMKLSQVHEYNKLIPQFMWVFFSMNGLIIVIKSCNLDKFVNTRGVQ